METEAADDEAEPAEPLTEEERLAKEEAERAAAEAKAEAEAKAKAAEAAAEALEAELKTFQRDVTLGHWAEVKAYLGGLQEETASVGYTQLLASLVKGPPKPKSPFAKYAE